MAVLEVRNLTKSFGNVVAVDGISFTVEAGEVFTIIGPNGAGKTTTLEMIEGLIIPDSGEIIFEGKTWSENMNDIKMKIGVQPQSSAMFELLSSEENLKLFASFFPKSKSTEEILSTINLMDHRHKRVKLLSGGQRQRLAIGLAMISDPDIIFLDEPTTGLDPQARRNIWDIVRKLKELGKTIIMTTHYMEEAEQLSDRVCIVDQGNIIAIDTPQNLIHQLTKERRVQLSFGDSIDSTLEIEEYAKSLPAVLKIERQDTTLYLWTDAPEDTLFNLFSYAKNQGFGIEQITIKEKSLEDVFIAHTGKEWRD